jgi:DNA-directed RNA polymerase subunit beta'
MMNQLREVATKRDSLILEERAKEAAKAAEKAAAEQPPAVEAETPALPPAE